MWPSPEGAEPSLYDTDLFRCVKVGNASNVEILNSGNIPATRFTLDKCWSLAGPQIWRRIILDNDIVHCTLTMNKNAGSLPAWPPLPKPAQDTCAAWREIQSRTKFCTHFSSHEMPGKLKILISCKVKLRVRKHPRSHKLQNEFEARLLSSNLAYCSIHCYGLRMVDCNTTGTWQGS